MKRVITIALTAFTLTALTTAKVQAETRLEGILNRTRPDAVTVINPTQPASQPSNGAQDNAKGLPQAPSATAGNQLSERDRLNQERFLFKVLPSQS